LEGGGVYGKEIGWWFVADGDSVAQQGIGFDRIPTES